MRLVEDNGKWDSALKAVYNTDKFSSVLKEFIQDEFQNNVDVEDLTVIDILSKWFKAFGTINNPLFNYLRTARYKMNTRKLSYEDLVLFNNAYAKNQIKKDDTKINDLNGLFGLLTNPGYYEGNNESKAYWIEIYQFLSRQKNVDTILKELNDDIRINVAGVDRSVKDLKQNNLLRQLVMFGGVKSNKLRPAIEIEQTLNELADINPAGLDTFEKENSEKEKNKQLKDKEATEKWLKSLSKEKLQTLIDTLKGLNLNAI